MQNVEYWHSGSPIIDQFLNSVHILSQDYESSAVYCLDIRYKRRFKLAVLFITVMRLFYILGLRRRMVDVVDLNTRSTFTKVQTLRTVTNPPRQTPSPITKPILHAHDIHGSCYASVQC